MRVIFSHVSRVCVVRGVVRDVSPVVQQRPPHARHAFLAMVIVVVRLAHDLLCTPAITGRERLVQLVENKSLWGRRRVLFEFRMYDGQVKSAWKTGENRTYRGNLG